MLDNIPVEWVQSVVDKFINIAKEMPEDGVMRTACLVRAEYYMDLLKAWQDVPRGTYE